MKNISISIICVFFISCSRTGHFESILTDSSNVTYWKMFTADSTEKYIDGHNRLSFSKNGEFEKYMALNLSERGEPPVNIDGIYDKTWSFNAQDSTLRVGGMKPFKLVKFEKDTIYLSSIIPRLWRLKLVRAHNVVSALSH